MIKHIHNQADYFFPEMPKWITHYGFAIMILLLFGFLGAASLIDYSDNQRFQIIITNTSQTARLDFDVYRRLQHEQPITVNGPFQRPVSGYLQKRIIAAKDNYVIVPAVILDTTLHLLPIDGQMTCEGSFKVSKGSLLENLVKSK